MRGGRRNRWVAVALVVLAVLTALGVTEATGVTQLAGTVVRIVTGEGTLIIESDDPAVQISLDGEVIRKELTLDSTVVLLTPVVLATAVSKKDTATLLSNAVRSYQKAKLA